MIERPSQRGWNRVQCNKVATEDGILVHNPGAGPQPRRYQRLKRVVIAILAFDSWYTEIVPEENLTVP